MGQIDLQGALTGGPPSGGDTFPAAVFTAPLRFRSNPKGFGVATGVLTQIVASPAVYLTLPGVGTGGVVTKADTFYLKSSGPIDLRLTTDDGAGGDVVSVVPCDGLHLSEFPTSKFLKLIEVQGSATIEYFASGQS
jgi:hypothetical protein